MSDTQWIIEPNRDPRRPPSVKHRHPNGVITVMPAPTSTISAPLGEPRVERRAFVCACGEVWMWERLAP
jgi:hypothetical protein